MRYRSINRNSAGESGSSFFNGWRSTPEQRRSLATRLAHLDDFAPGAPTVPIYQAHFRRWRICRRQDGARRVAHRGMEVGNREAIPCCRIRSLAQAMDRRKDIRLDQSQSPLGARLRTLCHDRHCLHPPRHDPHHAKATCCKRLVMNPIFSDGLSDKPHWGVNARTGISNNRCALFKRSALSRSSGQWRETRV